MKLKDSDHRCHDTRCTNKESCERWVQREGGGAHTVHASTMRPAWQCHEEFCDNAILVDGVEWPSEDE